MSILNGETTDLLHRLRSGDEEARGDLIGHACGRLRCLASRMLRGYPGVRRWEQTDDVLQGALMRLSNALQTERPENSLHFRRLAALQIRRELLDLVDRHLGPNRHGAHHHTDGRGAADDPDGALARQPGRACEPSSPAEWAEFLERVRALPEEEQDVFGLLWVDGLTQEQAAVVLQVSLRTLKRRWQSARLRLHRVDC